MDKARIMELLKGLPLTPEDLAAVPDSDVELLQKALAATPDITAEELKAVLSDEPAQTAAQNKDAEAFGQAVVEALQKSRSKRAKDEDEEDEDDDLDGLDDEDDDEGDDEDLEAPIKNKKSVRQSVLAAGRKVLGMKTDDEEKPKSRRVAKSVSQYLEEDEEVVLEAQAILEPLVKALDMRDEERTQGLQAQVEALEGEVRRLKKALTKGLQGVTEAVTGMARTPAGRAITPGTPTQPYSLFGGGATSADPDDPEHLAKSIIAAQMQGVIDGGESLELLDAAKRGGQELAEVRPRLAVIAKAVKETPAQ